MKSYLFIGVFLLGFLMTNFPVQAFCVYFKSNYTGNSQNAKIRVIVGTGDQKFDVSADATSNKKYCWNYKEVMHHYHQSKGALLKITVNTTTYNGYNDTYNHESGDWQIPNDGFAIVSITQDSLSCGIITVTIYDASSNTLYGGPMTMQDSAGCGSTGN